MTEQAISVCLHGCAMRRLRSRRRIRVERNVMFVILTSIVPVAR
jgi:hypothetical protein